MCCDVCSANGQNADDGQLPEIKREFNVVNTAPPTAHRVNVKYTASTLDNKQLFNKLTVWRFSEYKTSFKNDILLGPRMVMSDGILQRIVDVAHANRIQSIQDLIDQTGWTGSLTKRHGH